MSPTPRERFEAWLEGGPPPPLEAEIPEETVKRWRSEGLGPDETPEQAFGLARIEESGITFRKTGRVLADIGSEEGARRLRAHYSAGDPKRWPEDWPARVDRWRRDGSIAAIAGWHEGFFQAIGIRDAASLSSALLALVDSPERVHRYMEEHLEFILALLRRALADFRPTVGIFYEAIASNHGPVISPAMYARFALEPLRRIVETYRAAGVRFTFVRTAGAISGLIPVWMDAGIDGLFVNQTAAARIDYVALRRAHGPRLKFLGGIDWRLMARGREGAASLRRRAQELLDLGGAIPYLDDTARAYIAYDDFRRYRETLNDLMNPVAPPTKPQEVRDP
ncbi:MAG: hypothetical protein NTW86_25665 [Candidatus Sumerlaeota bacterium]|nr:hypothetical protein [Candidatus Sumerlaeota bacterium]